MSRTARLALALAIAVTPASVRAEAAAAEHATSPSDTLVQDAVAAYARGDFEAARHLFEEAHLMAPSARTERGLGVVALREQRYVAAMHHLRAALRSQTKPLPPALSQGVEALIAEAAPHVAELALTLQPASATLRDGDTKLLPEPDGVLLLAPGAHVLRCEAPGYQTAQLVAQLEGGTRQHLSVVLEPLPVSVAAPAGTLAGPDAPSVDELPLRVAHPAEDVRARPPSARPRRLRRALLGLGGATIAAGVAAAVTGGVAAGRIRGIERHCRDNPDGLCDADELDQLERDRHLARLSALTNVWLGLAAGGAAGTFGVLPFYWRTRRATGDHHAGLRLVHFF